MENPRAVSLLIYTEVSKLIFNGRRELINFMEGKR